jgi:hypothetical protein
MIRRAHQRVGAAGGTGWPEIRVGLALPRRLTSGAIMTGWLRRSCWSMTTMRFDH